MREKGARVKFPVQGSATGGVDRREIHSGPFFDYLHDLFSAFAPVTTRAMFGGHGVYREGVILGIVIDETLYLKVDEQTRAVFEAEGCQPFVYESRGKAVPMSYWTVPDEALDSPQEFRAWAQRAWEAALRKPKPRKLVRKKGAE